MHGGGGIGTVGVRRVRRPLRTAPVNQTYGVCCLRTRAAVARLRLEWDELVAASGADRIFMTWDWMDAWLSSFALGCEPRVWEIREGPENRLVGLVPLAIRRCRLGGRLWYRELVLLGAQPSAADHLDVIAHRDAGDGLRGCMLDCLDRSRHECDLVNFESFTAGGSALDAWLNRLPRPLVWQSTLPCPQIRLPSSWDQYVCTLGKHERASFRRCARKLGEAFPGQARYCRVESGAELREAMDDLVRLHGQVQHDRGRTSAFADPAVEAFHRELAQRLLQCGRLHCMRLLVNGRTIGVDYGFDHADTRSDYATGYDRNWLQFGPGRQVLARSIGDAVERGLKRYDLLRGGEPYKLTLASDVQQTLCVRMAATPRGLLALGAQGMVRWARRTDRRVRNQLRRHVFVPGLGFETGRLGV